MNGKLIVVYNPSIEVQQREKHYATRGDDEGARYIGSSMIYHNTCLDIECVVKQYSDKDMIERTFKQMKNVLSMRHIQMWLKAM